MQYLDSHRQKPFEEMNIQIIEPRNKKREQPKGKYSAFSWKIIFIKSRNGCRFCCCSLVMNVHLNKNARPFDNSTARKTHGIAECCGCRWRRALWLSISFSRALAFPQFVWRRTQVRRALQKYAKKKNPCSQPPNEHRLIRNSIVHLRHTPILRIVFIRKYRFTECK